MKVLKVYKECFFLVSLLVCLFVRNWLRNWPELQTWNLGYVWGTCCCDEQVLRSKQYLNHFVRKVTKCLGLSDFRVTIKLCSLSIGAVTPNQRCQKGNYQLCQILEFSNYARKLHRKIHNKCNYARSKPERVKLCQNYAKIVSVKSLCQNYARSCRNYARIRLDHVVTIPELG